MAQPRCRTPTGATPPPSARQAVPTALTGSGWRCFDPKLTGVTSTAPDRNAGAARPTRNTTTSRPPRPTPPTGPRARTASTTAPANSNNGNFGWDGYPAVDQVTGKVFEASGGAQRHRTLPQHRHAGRRQPANLCFLDDTRRPPSAATPSSGVPERDRPDHGGERSRRRSPTCSSPVSSMDTGRNLHVTYAVSGAVSSSDGGATGTSTLPGVHDRGQRRPPVGRRGPRPCRSARRRPTSTSSRGWSPGGPGRSDSVWYGTNSFIDPSTNGGQSWNVYMAQVVWPSAARTARPWTSAARRRRQQVKVSPHPNALQQHLSPGHRLHHLPG